MSKHLGKRLKQAKRRKSQQQDKSAKAIRDMWRRLAKHRGNEPPE